MLIEIDARYLKKFFLFVLALKRCDIQGYKNDGFFVCSSPLDRVNLGERLINDTRRLDGTFHGTRRHRPKVKL